MKRRDFLTGVGAMGAAAAFGRWPLGFPAREDAFKKAVKIGMVGTGGSLTEKFLLLRELGFDGVEMDSPGGPPLDEVLAAKEASGLIVHGVVDSAHWSQPFSSPDAEVRAAGARALEQALRDAKAWGATSVLVVPAVVDKRVTYADAWERAHAEISRLLPLAAELEVRILFENVWNNFLLSPLETARWIDSFSSKWVGAYFDVGNVLRYGWPEHWIQALGPRIKKVDVKEFSRKKMNDEGLWKGFDVELHEGDCDWPAVTSALRTFGYDGWFTAEVAGGGRERLTRLAADLDRIFAA